MKTVDLIDTLAADPAARAVRSAPAIAVSALIGAAAVFVIIFLWIGFQPMAPMAVQGWFWMKMAYTWVLAGAGLVIVIRLASPGRGLGLAPLAVVASVAAMGVLSALEIIHPPAGGIGELLSGHGSDNCSAKILVLSAPVYALLIVALRRFAPTRLAATGAAAGLLAGAVAASVYNLACMGTSATFVLTWFTPGIAAAASLGALIGRRLLRW